MTDLPVRPTRLAGHGDALRNLLEGLLAEQPEVVPPQPGERREVNEGPAAASAFNPAAAQPLTTAVPAKTQVADDVPAWCRQDLRVLLFRIGDFRFGMPLVLMRSVLAMPERRNRVPAQPPWHQGLVSHRGASLLVVDLGSLAGIKARCAAPRYLLVIGDGHAALQCDRIEDAIVLDERNVRWRRAGPGQAWLAGLMVQQMCGLVDADVIGRRIGHG